MAESIKFKRLPHAGDLERPCFMSTGAAGMDIRAAQGGWIPPGEVVKFKTGFAVAVPQGYEMQCRSRSGLASTGLMVANSPGTIDSDYRGEICVLLYNSTTRPREIVYGDRIAQLVVSQVPVLFTEEVDELDETERGEGGFGSTGTNG